MFTKKYPIFQFELGNKEKYIDADVEFIVHQFKKGEKSSVLKAMSKGQCSYWANIFEDDNFKKNPENYLKIYFKNRYENDKDEINIKYDIFLRRWTEIYEKYSLSLLKYFNLKKANSEKIISYFSFIPISPRILGNWSAPVSIDRGLPNQIIIMAHEIFHFYWFQKISEIMPNYLNKIGHSEMLKVFNSPYLVWHLSEILDIVILGNEKYFHECFNDDEINFISNLKGYPIHRNVKINDLNLIEYFKKIYLEYKHLGIETFLKISLIKIYQLKDKFPEDRYKISEITENYIAEFKKDENLKNYF